jgi:hypothetical protein
MPVKNKGLLPPELARKISPWYVNQAEMTGAVGKTALIGAMVLSLFGPDDHNGFLFLLGPWVCPALFTCFWSAFLAHTRSRVFRGWPTTEHSFVDNDPVVTRLAELLNSHEARQHLWRESLKISTILFAVLAPAAFLLGDSLNWAYPSPENHFFRTARAGIPGYRAGVPGYWFWPGLFSCSLFAFLFLGSDYYRWCLTTWAKRESADHGEVHRTA